MRRLNLVLLASLQLCRARQPGFSIHDDLLAHPQFEVVFLDDFISETDALALLESSRSYHPVSSVDASETDVASKVRESTVAEPPTGYRDGDRTADDDEEGPISETYELINSAPWRYLCSVPVIAPPPALNQTATELAKAEEARELSRASAKGWELLRGLHGTCMFFTWGWWSYSYCYDEGVVQFHALQNSLNKMNGPPVRDEKSQEYVLGRVPESWESRPPAASNPGTEDGQTKSLAPPNSQLQVKGDQRYLSQRLEGGTICDLTNRPRTIEIQYHCAPGTSTDRIGWIKEITTCTYLMLVYTPRLCDDVAFQPPKVTRAHPIRCRQIIGNEEEKSAWSYHKRVEADELSNQKAAAQPDTQQPSANKDKNTFTGLSIGGIAIGAHKVLGGTTGDGKPGHRLAPPRHITDVYSQAKTHVLGEGGKETVVQILASKKKDADKVDRMSDAELKNLGLDPGEVQEFQKRMEGLAGDRGWQLQVVDVPGEGLELVGAFDEEDSEVQQEGQKQGENKDGNGRHKGERKNGLPTQERGEQKGQAKKAREKKEEVRDQGGEEQEGSEEVFFKEEL
ncbi:hypothetical protein VTI74DRAFT_315 [Chaetomium olivicolor]